MKYHTLLATFLVTTIATGCATQDMARDVAAHRTRRVIFNNDGDDALHYGKLHTDPNTPASRKGLSALRMDHIADTGVDSVFYCTTQSFNSFTHDSEVTEVFDTTEGAFGGNRTRQLIDQGADPLQVAIDACRKHDIEIFWTIRMNDIHDNFWSEMISQWKKDKPHLLMGKKEDKTTYSNRDPRHIWTWADFDHEAVRNQMVTIVRDVLDRYDVDGIDLDFLRHPAFFKQTLVSEPATTQQLDKMTDMVRQIRRDVLTASKRRGRSILLSVRILPTLELNRRWGFDAQRWIKDELVDFIAIGGGYDPFTMPTRDMVKHGHAWGVPVYVCLSGSGFQAAAGGAKGSKLSGNIECWRAAAANAWYTGADGIMTFNLFPKLPDTEATHKTRRIWKQISDPKGLAHLDKIYCIENLTNNWNFCGAVRSVPIDGRLPVKVQRGASVERKLPVADDVAGAQDRLEMLELRIHLSELATSDKIRITMNDVDVPMVPRGSGWLAGTVPPTAIQKGDNKLIVSHLAGESESLTLTSVDLTVRYTSS